MATRRARKLAEQLDRNLMNLRVDLRRNAPGYKAAFAQGRTVEQIAQAMARDAAAYLVRLGWHVALRTDFRALYDAALVHIDETDAEHTAEWTELRNAAIVQRDGAKTTQAEIEALSDSVLAAVTEHESLWAGG